MPEMTIYGTDTKLKVDAKYAKMLPGSIWTVTKGYSKPTPVCRYQGRTMSVARAIGLMVGMSNCQYILPKNGDPFDCRLRNVHPMAFVPTAKRAVYKNSKSGIKGIRSSKGRYNVVLCHNGRQLHFGSTADIDAAKVILRNAQSTLNA